MEEELEEVDMTAPVVVGADGSSSQEAITWAADGSVSHGVLHHAPCPVAAGEA
jgi:nucleotide-binding universal stress UspA family protein